LFLGVRNVVVNLRGGEDTLRVANGLQLPGTVTLNMGEDKAHVIINGDTLLGGSLTINAGNGDDDVSVNNKLTLGGNLGIFLANGNVNISGLAISYGSGTTRVDFGGAGDINVNVNGAITINSTEGDDLIFLGKTAKALNARSISISTGNGNQTVTFDGAVNVT